MKEKAKFNRISWIDIARGMCIIAIVIGHTLKNSWLRTYALSFDVPMFFFLSGYCYRHTNDIKKYFIKKIKTIIIPYFSFSLLSIIFFAIAGKVVNQLNDILDCSIAHNMIVMIYGNSKPDIMKYNSPLWFLTCFFSVLVMSYAIEWTMRKFKNSNVMRGIGIIVLIFVGGGISRPEIALPWHLETAVSMLVWFELGILIKNYSINKTAVILSNNACISLIILITGGVFCFVNRNIVGTSLQVRQDIYGNYFLYYLSAAFGIYGFCAISKMIASNRVIEYFGRNSLAILALHKFPVLLFQQMVPFTRELLKDSNTALGIVCGVIVSALSILIALTGGEVIRKICPFMIGETKLG